MNVNRGWCGLGMLWFVASALGAPPTTDSSIAWANVQAQIERAGDSPAADGLWLLRLRLLADEAALDWVAAQSMASANSADGYLRRARHHAALHRFADVLLDLQAAAQLGASSDELVMARNMLRIASGQATEVLPARRPDSIPIWPT